MFNLALCLTFVMFVAPIEVNAYLDPGSGSLIVQFLIGAVLGSLYFIKLYWSKIKKFITSAFQKEKKDEKGTANAK